MSYNEPHLVGQNYDPMSSHFRPYSSSSYSQQKHLVSTSSGPIPSPQILPHVPLSERTDFLERDHRRLQVYPPHIPQEHSHSLYPASSRLPPLNTPQQFQSQPNSWSPYDHGISAGLEQAVSIPYSSYSTPTSFTGQPLARQLNTAPPNAVPRLALAGSLDPTTGIFYRTPEHPRLRTAQACEKCRTRKAKVYFFASLISSGSSICILHQQCSGEHPSCKRCLARGLQCEYAKEGRVRGPNKPKIKNGISTTEPVAHSTSRGRKPSTKGVSNSKFDGSEMTHQNHAAKRMSLPMQLTPRRSSLSLGEHRSSRLRPPDLHLGQSSHWELPVGVKMEAEEGFLPLQNPSTIQPSYELYSQSIRSNIPSHSSESSLQHAMSPMAMYQQMHPEQHSALVDDLNFGDDGGSSCSSSNTSGQSQSQSMSHVFPGELTPSAYHSRREDSLGHSDGGSLSACVQFPITTSHLSDDSFSVSFRRFAVPTPPPR